MGFMSHGLLEPVIILLAALAGGFCSSAPLGAINLWVTDALLAHREARLRFFLSGVIAMDCVHASFAAWGYHAFFDEGAVARWLSVLGGAFLIVLGSLSLLNRAKARHDPPVDPRGPGRRPLNDVLLGSFMCGANPAFLMFWVFAIDQVERHAHTQDILGWRLGVFLLGVAVGDSLWFLCLLNLVRKGREAVKPRVLASVRATIAMAFVLVGTIAVYRGFKLH
jgi:threonine/homoserine/homoserine lactone efflux protein